MTDDCTRLVQLISCASESLSPSRVDVIVEVAGVSSLVSEGLSVLRFGGHYGTFLARSLSCCCLSSVLEYPIGRVCNLQSMVPFSCPALLGMVHPKSQLSSVTGEQVSGARDDGYGSQVGIHCDRR